MILAGHTEEDRQRLLHCHTNFLAPSDTLTRPAYQGTCMQWQSAHMKTAELLTMQMFHTRNTNKATASNSTCQRAASVYIGLRYDAQRHNLFVSFSVYSTYGIDDLTLLSWGRTRKPTSVNKIATQVVDNAVLIAHSST